VTFVTICGKQHYLGSEQLSSLKRNAFFQHWSRSGFNQNTNRPDNVIKNEISFAVR